MSQRRVLFDALFAVLQVGVVMRMAWRGRPRGVGQVALLGVLLLLLLSLFLLTATRIAPLAATPSFPASPCLSHPLASEADPRQVALYFTPRSRPITEVVSRFLVQPQPGLCSLQLDLLVLVPSPPGAEDVRDTIRDTWGSVVRTGWPHVQWERKVALVFVLGRHPQPRRFNLTALRQEAVAHGDLLVGDFRDTYRNLTRKMMAGLHWVSRKCPRARYVLKADQDTFVNVAGLLAVLSQLQLAQPALGNTVLGEVLCSESVNRDPASPVRVAASVYPFSTYPPYARGGSYVLPGALVAQLVNASRYMPYLPVEDAFINGVLARVLRAQHVHLPRVMRGLACSVSPCVFLTTQQLTATNVDLAMMRAIWSALLAGPRHCQQHASLWDWLCVWSSTHWS